MKSKQMDARKSDGYLFIFCVFCPDDEKPLVNVFCGVQLSTTTTVARLAYTQDHSGGGALFMSRRESNHGEH